MFYMQRHQCYFRDYGAVGYLLNVNERADRVVDEIGTAFLASLRRHPRALAEIAADLAKRFGVEPSVVESDAGEFFDELVSDGFLARGQSQAECREDASRPVLKPASHHVESLRPNQPDSSEFLAHYFATDPKLVAMQVEVTSQCNERCLHCYIPTSKRSKGIDPGFFRSILEQASELQLISLALSGGEPMIHPEFNRLLSIASEFDFSLRILSNLTLLDDAKLSAMVDARVDLVSVSIYSLEPEVHDAVTLRRGSLRKSLAAIERLRLAGIRVSVNVPVLKTNRDSVGDVMRWARDQSMSIVTDCTIMARYDHSTDNLVHRLTESDVEVALWQVINANPDYTLEILAEGAGSRRKIDPQSPVCGVGLSTISVIANGNVNPCAGWQGEVLGNLHEQSLADIWLESPGILRLRDLRMKDLSECLSCVDSAFCAICLVRNANSNDQGDPLKLSRAHCRSARINHQLVEQVMADN